MSEWISVKDKENQPVVNETILITDCCIVSAGFLGKDLKYYMRNIDDEFETCESLNFYVTDWMPLPEVPLEIKKEIE